MESNLTKCPKCLTAFKVDNQQLEAADGAVRCGACLSVFNARENLIKEDLENNPTSSETTPISDDSDVHWTQALGNDVDKIFEYLASELELNSDPDLAQQLQHDQWGRDLLAELDEQTPTETIPLPVQAVDFLEATSDEIASPGESNETPVEPLLENAISSSHNEQDSDFHPPTFEDPLSEQLLELPNTFEPLLENELTEQPKAIEDTLSEGATNETTGDTDEEKDDEEELTETESGAGDPEIIPNFVDPVGLERDSQDEHNHSDWHPGILEELEHQSRNIAASIQDALDTASAETKKTSRQEPEYSLKDLASLPLSAQRHVQSNIEGDLTQIPSEQPLETNSLDQLGSALQAELTQEALSTSKTFNTKALATFALCLFAMSTLFGQYAYFRADSLSKDTRYRPYYEKACALLNCKLKPMEAFDALKITKLHVRDHTSVETALIIDVNLFNGALFEQPFPDIELAFSDQNDQIVAQRRFTPNEYRGETLKQLELIPSLQLVHIVLEIVDPNPGVPLSHRHKLHKSQI